MNFIELKPILKKTFQETNKVAWIFFKIMIPALIIMALLEHYGFAAYLGKKIEPMMGVLGIPAYSGFIWAGALCTNIYGGVALFAVQPEGIEWTQAQVIILGTLMLVAHNFPVELVVAQKSGCRVWFNTFLRLFSAIMLGYLLNLFFDYTGLMQEPAIARIPDSKASSAFLYLSNLFSYIISSQAICNWLAQHVILCVRIYFVIMALIIMIKFLRYVGIERLVTFFLKPILKVLGIKPEAASITIIGMLLGLAYGGGLLINEAESGKINKEDVFASICLLSVCHSLIEDTLLISLMGADITTLIFSRLLFGLLITFLIVRLNRKSSAFFSEKFLVTSVVKPQAPERSL